MLQLVRGLITHMNNGTLLKQIGDIISRQDSRIQRRVQRSVKNNVITSTGSKVNNGLDSPPIELIEAVRKETENE